MVDQRLARALGVGVALFLAAASCQSDAGGTATDRTTEDCSAAGDCDEVESAYINCFWVAAAYICDETLGTLPVGCDDERSAVKGCLGAAAGAGGAGAAIAGAGGALPAASGAGAAGEAAAGGAP